MGFRTIVITTHSKLELSLNYLVFKTVNDIKRINIDEIQTLIIESTAVAITAALLVELINKKIKVIFCDSKKNPSCELISYYGDSITSRRIDEQIHWSDDSKDKIWQAIVIEKIKNQAKVLSSVSKEDADIVSSFANEVEIGDKTNREGHAAKYYFNRIYGQGFNRNNNHEKNAYLNYGYSILLSQFNRNIVAKGYLTQIGIHHRNDFNQFNLSCDLMEPFRPIVDKMAFSLTDDNFKDELIKMLNMIVIIDGQQQLLANAIGIYCASVFNALNKKDASLIKFYSENER